MTVKKLTEVNEFRLMLYPKDFDRVRNFYNNVLGYDVVKEWDRGVDDRGVMFSVGGVTLELLTSPDEYEPVQNAALSLKVGDVNALFESIKDEVLVVYKPRHNSWGDTSFKIKDPEGFEITFFTKD
jgi:catechol 2,3-dioxygenase-like lactoylglutathione lyase family enzyme